MDAESVTPHVCDKPYSSVMFHLDWDWLPLGIWMNGVGGCTVLYLILEIWVPIIPTKMKNTTTWIFEFFNSFNDASSIKRDKKSKAPYLILCPSLAIWYTGNYFHWQLLNHIPEITDNAIYTKEIECTSILDSCPIFILPSIWIFVPYVVLSILS